MQISLRIIAYAGNYVSGPVIPIFIGYPIRIGSENVLELLLRQYHGRRSVRIV